MLRVAKPGYIADRGVWIANFLGPNGEMVLLPVTSKGMLATGLPVIVPNGASRIDASDRCWDAIEATDPEPFMRLKAI
jgi:hypothetical protein